MNKYTLVMLSVIGGCISGLAWTDWCTGLVLLIGFVPFFLIEHYISSNRYKYSENAFFLYLLPGFVAFCIISLGWIRVISIIAAIGVIMGVSFLMAFTMWLAHKIKIKAGTIPGYVAFISFWLTFEFLCLYTDILSPWVNLGNGLSKDIRFIQWYEITGTAGGSLWILTSNILLAVIITGSQTEKKKSVLFTIIWLPIILIPVLISFYRYNNIEEKDQEETEIVIIQPNFDPYTEKFTIPFEKQLEKVIGMAEPIVTEKTAWVITPETTVDDPVNEDDIFVNKYVEMLRELSYDNPHTSIVAGMVTFRHSGPTPETVVAGKKQTGRSDLFYETYNSALQIDTSNTVKVYHKSKLVAGFETQFSPALGRIISKLLPALGGINRDYGIQEERICFEQPLSREKAAPIICYESVYGKHVSGYVREGANMLFIITNDGWWKNSLGYKQHLSFASIRAIETRRPVARAANTGISCFIDIKGRLSEKTGWWTCETLKSNIIAESRMTPYVKYGDYILSFSIIISAIVMITAFIVIPIKRKNKTSRII
jgi:apolipoprotein N-acyltransferase